MHELSASELDAISELAIMPQLLLDLADGMDDGRVVSTSECLSDLHQLHAQDVACEEHGYLSWHGEHLGA
jgi:hypothetical protein